MSAIDYPKFPETVEEVETDGGLWRRSDDR